jgi:hypothetical protein
LNGTVVKYFYINVGLGPAYSDRQQSVDDLIGNRISQFDRDVRVSHFINFEKVGDDKTPHHGFCLYLSLRWQIPFLNVTVIQYGYWEESAEKIPEKKP